MQDRLSIVRLPISGQGATFAYTGTAGVSSALTIGAAGVWVWCTSDAYVTVGPDVTATTTDWPIPAYQMVWIPVPEDAPRASRVSAIQVSAGGSAYFIAGE